MTVAALEWLRAQAWFIALAALLGSRALVAAGMALWHVWRGRCEVGWCWRAGTVEVRGTLWKTCASHARTSVHLDLDRRWRLERDGGWETYR